MFHIFSFLLLYLKTQTHYQKKAINTDCFSLTLRGATTCYYRSQFSLAVSFSVYHFASIPHTFMTFDLLYQTLVHLTASLVPTWLCRQLHLVICCSANYHVTLSSITEPGSGQQLGTSVYMLPYITLYECTGLVKSVCRISASWLWCACNHMYFHLHVHWYV